MENDLIKSKIQQALDCVQNLDEPYRSLAFRVTLEKLLSEEVTMQKAPEHVAASQEKGLPPINEYFSALHPKAYTDAVVIIAYYLLHGEKRELFTIQDIADRLSRCRAEKPKNLSDVLAGCARNGWLAEGDYKQGGMKSWYLTATGEKYVALKLTRNG
ncbi:MAG TPA: hypothetical protein VFA47_12980 [Candidatus Manganitrophaceae bacterium]|nr:hypothetical protein [Candidatus Manganitrophaceae bacterium]